MHTHTAGGFAVRCQHATLSRCSDDMCFMSSSRPSSGSECQYLSGSFMYASPSVASSFGTAVSAWTADFSAACVFVCVAPAAGASFLALALRSLLLLAAAAALAGEHSYTDRVPNQHQSSHTRKHASNGSSCGGRGAHLAGAFPAIMWADLASAALL